MNMLGVLIHKQLMTLYEEYVPRCARARRPLTDPAEATCSSPQCIQTQIYVHEHDIQSTIQWETCILWSEIYKSHV